VSTFARLAPRLQEAIVSRLGWSKLHPVQEEAGEALLAGCNAVVLAPTAGGKTEAALFPVLSRLMEDGASGVGALYLAPIKALLNNQADRLGLYTEMVGLRRFVWHGDTASHERRRFLKEPTELLMTTPESLEVMLMSRRIDAAALFGELQVAVIDEVHALAGTDRGAHLMSILERLVRLSRHDVQRVGLSATVGNPAAILDWLRGTSEREGRVVDPPREPVRRRVEIVYRQSLASVAHAAADLAKAQKSLFFCQSRATTEAVAEHMRRAGTSVLVHHSAVSREERELAEERFHHGSDACIVCTSTLELGIDVGDLDRVLQAEAPDTVSSFLQRMGRTGRRAGQTANTSFFCETTEGVLQAIALVELAKGGWVEPIHVPQRCWPVLIHQLLALSLASDGVTMDNAWSQLSRVPDFSGIYRPEFDRLVSWMLRDDALRLASGRLIIGPKAERRFGRRHFMELCAVFSSPQTYTVQTGTGRPLGTLTQAFVDRLVDGVSTFLLGGRAWVVLRIQHDDRRVVVETAPRGREPTWGGFLPQFLGFELCQRIRQTLLAEEAVPYLDSEAAAALSARRSEMRDVLRDGEGIEVLPGEIRWWTFAGGRINATLRYALQAVDREWVVIPDNFALKIRKDGLDVSRFQAALVRLRELELWEDETLWTHVMMSLPNYRLSKFQPLMPPWVEREVVASYLLDVGGAWHWLSGKPANLMPVPLAVLPGTEDDERRLAALESPAASLPPLTRDSSRPLIWVRSDAALSAAVESLMQETIVGLDVETTLDTRALCLIQLAGRTTTWLVDAFEITDFTALSPILSNERITKVIHHAPFELEVLGRYGLALRQVFDTREASRRIHGEERAADGHGLRAVCERELGKSLDKSEQTSDWSRRPLRDCQITYAALDAEVLWPLYDRLALSLARREQCQ
jgi:ATP-dependent helicase Lhr and Lhr-like helicase